MVTGSKPKLSKPNHTKRIKTPQELLMALGNLSFHYGRVGENDRKRLIEQHTASMRELLHHGTLMGSHEQFIQLDKSLRDHRCRVGRRDS